MFGRYEFHDESTNSHKFWSCKNLNDGTCEISWGRIGARGQSQVKDLATATKKISEKISKGYRLVFEYASEQVEQREEKRKRKTESAFVRGLREVK